MRIFIFILSALFVITAKAKTTAQDCPQGTEEKYGTTVVRTFYADIGLCSIGVSPKDAWQVLTYRDYSIASDGLFMVFNSYGNSGNFSVRDFMLFPRVNESISYKWNDATRELVVTGASNDVYTFNADTAQIKSISGAKKVTVGPVNHNNRGGVEIQGYKGQILDIGYTTGQDPSQNKEGLSKYNRGTSSCHIKNSALFSYMSNGDIQFKFDNDKEFLSVIKSQCK
ncbi:MAG: hypothetical protein ACM3MG_06840 [Bacillota bacterium]